MDSIVNKNNKDKLSFDRKYFGKTLKEFADFIDKQKELEDKRNMENKTKGKPKGDLDQYVDFLLKVQNCNYPFMDNIRELDKREATKRVDKLNLVHDEPGDISNKTYEKLTSDIIKSWFKDMEAEKPKAHINWSFVSPNSAYPNITEDPTAELVFQGRKYKGNAVGYVALEDYVDIKKGTKSFMKREGSNAYLFTAIKGGYMEVLHGLDWKPRFKKITKFGEDLIPVTSSAKFVTVKRDPNKFGVEELRKMQDVNPTKPKSTPKTYHLANVYTFKKDFEIDRTTKEYIPKGEFTYQTRSGHYCITSNLGVKHLITLDALNNILDSYVDLTKEVKPQI